MSSRSCVLVFLYLGISRASLPVGDETAPTQYSLTDVIGKNMTVGEGTEHPDGGCVGVPRSAEQVTDLVGNMLPKRRRPEPLVNAGADCLQEIRRRSQNGDVAAMYDLGLALYHGGEGVECDPIRALAMLEKAGRLGHAKACFDLGGLYAEGTWVPQDLSTAVAWYDRAALLGNRIARYLGDKYRQILNEAHTAEISELLHIDDYDARGV